MANFIIDIINGALNGLVTALNFVLQLLPDSPFQSITLGPVAEYIGYVNWFFPIQEILLFLSVWLAAVLIYYAYTVILRVTQAID